MQKQDNKTVLAVVNDLFFSVKITDAAKRAGMPVEFIKDEKEVIAKAKTRPTLIIFDLNFADVQPLKLISELKTGADFKGISVIGYLSHVQAELKMQAQEAGCDMVMARSAFSQNLPQILKRHSGSL
jgi:PleD family two-component response regulator